MHEISFAIHITYLRSINIFNFFYNFHGDRWKLSDESGQFGLVAARVLCRIQIICHKQIIKNLIDI